MRLDIKQQEMAVRGIAWRIKRLLAHEVGHSSRKRSLAASRASSGGSGAIGREEVPHDRPVVRGATVPPAGGSLRAHRERLVGHADVGPSEVRCHRPRGDGRNEPPVRIAELRSLIRTEFDRVSMLMDEMMVLRTEQDPVHQTGFTSICPVLYVVAFQEQAIRTSRVRARLVSLVQRALQ